VLAFSDGLFAIAMTLLVVGVTIPTLDSADDIGELADALSDQESSFISFFISFAVIGRYWIAHHHMFSLIARVDDGLVWINLVYLAFIAFLPFPTALLGTYFENPLSIAIYAVNVALISGLEVVLFRHTYRNRLLARAMPEDVYRWGAALSLTPVLFFVLSIPIAFVSTPLAVASWFLAVPFDWVAERWKPAEADQYL
jgi:uncharacterized membrane protein